MGRSSNDEKATKLAKKITLFQLKKWKVKYHFIKFGKPSYDLLVDDKSLFSRKIGIKIFKIIKVLWKIILNF